MQSFFKNSKAELKKSILNTNIKVTLIILYSKPKSNFELDFLI